MKKWLFVVLTLAVCASMTFSAEVRKLTREDLEWGNADTTVTSAAGHTGHYFDNTYNRSAPYVDVRSVGFTATNTAESNSSLWNSNVVSNKTYFIPAGTFAIGSELIFPDNVVVIGMGKKNTIIQKQFNGDMATLGDSVTITDLTFDGNGATYTGRGLLLEDTNGRQSIFRVRIIDTEDYAVQFDLLAGSQSTWVDCLMYQYDGLTADQFAVYIPNELNDEATPRKFIGIESNGRKFIDLGGSNNTYISNSFVGEIKFRSETRGVQITGSRVVGDSDSKMEITGYNISLAGNNISPDITIMPSASLVTVQANTTNNGYHDNSVYYTNLINIPLKEYTPTITSVGDDFSVGNAVNRGKYSRNGQTCTVCIDFTVGSTTDMGTGNITWSLPDDCGVSDVIQANPGGAFVIDADPSLYRLGMMSVVPSDSLIHFIFDNTAAELTSTNPITFAEGDVVRGCATYVR